MDARISDVDVLPDPATDLERLFVQIVAMPHHYKVVAFGQAFGGKAPISRSQTLPTLDRKLAGIAWGTLPTVLAAFFPDRLDELPGTTRIAAFNGGLRRIPRKIR